MASIATLDRIEMLAQRLESLTNGTGKEYMAELDAYMKTLKVIRTWPNPHVNLDKSEGVVWIALIPILYFLFVFLILGVLVSYIWYGQRWKERAKHVDSGWATPDALSNRLHNNNSNYNENSNNSRNSKHKYTCSNNNNNNNNSNANFVRSRFETGKSNSDIIGSAIRASLTSKRSNRSVDVHKNDINDNDYQSIAGSPFSTATYPFSHRTRKCQDPFSNVRDEIGNRNESSRCSLRYPINISIASQSFYSNEDSGGDLDESRDNGDIISRDSLRTSMESQKLLATGVMEIAPDDLYSMSDNTAYAGDEDDDDNGHVMKCHQIQPANKSSHHEICEISGFENPSFQIESEITDKQNQFLEDPMGYLIDHSNDLELEEKMCDEFGQENNISSVSMATHFQTSFLGGTKHSNSESFSASSSNMGHFLNIQGTIDQSLDKNKQFAKPTEEKTLYPSVSNVDGETLVRNNYIGHVGVGVGVGRALPPLPPSHYPRQQREDPGGLRQHQPTGYHNRRVDPNAFDTSSLLDTSNESGNLSLSSSIAKFHASRVKSCNDFPMDELQKAMPAQDANWSIDHVTPDTLSMYPNRGSFSQSFEESKLNVGSIKGECHSFLECSEDAEEGKEKRQARYHAESQNGSCGHIDADDPCKQLDIQQSREGESSTKDVIRSDKNPRMKRMMSLDWLKSGKVSVERRLKEFGYVRPKGKKTYVETEGLA